MIVQCICLNAIWSIHIQTIMIYIGVQCIVFNIVSGRLLTFACGMIPDFSFQFHASVWAICKQNGGEIKSWSLASSSDPTVWPFKAHGITLQELHQSKWMHHLWPRNHFFFYGNGWHKATHPIRFSNLPTFATQRECHQMLPPPWLQNTNCNWLQLHPWAFFHIFSFSVFMATGLGGSA